MRPLLLLSPCLLLLTACPAATGTFFEDPDPEPTAPPQDPDPGEDARMGWVQLERSWTLGGGASVRATASFHTPQEYARWPAESAELDGCAAGENDAGEWSLPDSDLDVGTPFLHLGDEELELTRNGATWARQLSTSYWEEHQEFTMRLTGGPDLPAQFYEAVIGTPATLTLEDFTESAAGLTVTWTGANDDGELRVLVSSDTDPSLWVYCRWHDDGEQTLPWTELVGVLPEGDYTFEARRQTSTNFELGDYPGTTAGISSATAELFVRADARDSSDGN